VACVYIFRHGNKNKFKIGRTKKSAKVRLKKLQTGNPDLTICDVIETEYDILRRHDCTPASNILLPGSK
jgi:hypothetical protein